MSKDDEKRNEQAKKHKYKSVDKRRRDQKKDPKEKAKEVRTDMVISIETMGKHH